MGFLEGTVAVKEDIDLNAVYLGLEKNVLSLSEHKPPSMENADKISFYSIKKYLTNTSYLVGFQIDGVDLGDLEKLLNLKVGEEISFKELSGGGFGNPQAELFTKVDLNGYTLRFGRDKKGIYTGIFDIWDFEPDAGFFQSSRYAHWAYGLGSKILPKIGTPIYFYDRLYWAENGVSDEDIRQEIKSPTEKSKNKSDRLGTM